MKKKYNYDDTVEALLERDAKHREQRDRAVEIIVAKRWFGITGYDAIDIVLQKLEEQIREEN